MVVRHESRRFNVFLAPWLLFFFCFDGGMTVVVEGMEEERGIGVLGVLDGVDMGIEAVAAVAVVPKASTRTILVSRPSFDVTRIMFSVPSSSSSSEGEEEAEEELLTPPTVSVRVFSWTTIASEATNNVDFLLFRCVPLFPPPSTERTGVFRVGGGVLEGGFIIGIPWSLPSGSSSSSCSSSPCV